MEQFEAIDISDIAEKYLSDQSRRDRDNLVYNVGRLAERWSSAEDVSKLLKQYGPGVGGFIKAAMARMIPEAKRAEMQERGIAIPVD